MLNGMSIFYKHNFIELINSKEMFYCSCGKIVSIHVHKWEKHANIIMFGNIGGVVLKCVACGELKKFEV